MLDLLFPSEGLQLSQLLVELSSADELFDLTHDSFVEGLAFRGYELVPADLSERIDDFGLVFILLECLRKSINVLNDAVAKEIIQS